MAQKEKNQKSKPQPKRKLIRFKYNINLLKHMKAVMLLTGFSLSLLSLAYFSSQANNSDIRSRSQVLIPTPTPMCPDGICLTITPQPTGK